MPDNNKTRNGPSPGPPDPSLWDENRSKVPPEQLLPYAGQHVAWSANGTTIVASGSDIPSLERNLVALGIDPTEVVFGYIDPPAYFNTLRPFSVAIARKSN